MDDKCDFLGLPITLKSAEAVADQILIGDQGGSPAKHVACLNPHSYVTARSNPKFWMALGESDLLLPDGIGVVLGARLLGLKVREKVAGYDVFLATLRVLDAVGGSICFVGSSPEVLAAIEVRLAKEFPHLKSVETYSPPYKEVLSEADNVLILDFINSSAPDVLCIGMTAPKQELWVQKNRDKLECKAVLSIGAVFDFYAESKTRGPSLLRDAGFEWLIRLSSDPLRLAPRTFRSAPVFVWAVVKEKLRRVLKGERH